MPIPELPPLPPAVVCSIAAAASYGLPANIILAVADMEGGRPGIWVRNNNGTYDVGAMQFNTAYLKSLARYGITEAAVAADNCYPYELAAWRLRKHIREDSGDLWTRVANYHSKNALFNAPYRNVLVRRARRWAQWLATRFRTYEMPSPVAGGGPTPVVDQIARHEIRATIVRSPHSADDHSKPSVNSTESRKAYVSRAIAIREPIEEGAP